MGATKTIAIGEKKKSRNHAEERKEERKEDNTNSEKY